MLFLCPKCKKELNIIDGRCVCLDGHSYDKGKGGYYNLLLGNSGGTHGDNKEMVLARRDFLSRGYYLSLAENVASLILKYTKKGGVVLDSGSGEGYYTDIVEKMLSARDEKTNVSGFDISKDAVRVAAKKNGKITYAVASAYKMPIGDSSVDTVSNIFSPLAKDEVHRVLKNGGKFIMAIPDEEHLYDLKAKIYDTPYKNTVEDTKLPGFRLIEEKKVHYNMELDSREAIKSLFMMTPYAYRTKPENKARIESLDSLFCRAEFILFVYEKE